MAYDVPPKVGVVTDPELPEYQTGAYKQRAGEIILGFLEGIDIAK